MPIYSTVYPLRPINKTAAKGCSGVPRFEKSENLTIKKDVKPEDWSKCGIPPKMSYEELVARNNEIVGGRDCAVVKRERSNAATGVKPRELARLWESRWGRLWHWVKKESLFIARNRLSRNDEVYQFVVAMKLNGFKPMKVRLVQESSFWKMVPASGQGGVNSLMQLANRLNCSIKIEGSREEMLGQLKKLELLFRNYELLGWSVEGE